MLLFFVDLCNIFVRAMAVGTIAGCASLVNGDLEISRPGNTTSNIGPEFSREKTGKSVFLISDREQFIYSQEDLKTSFYILKSFFRTHVQLSFFFSTGKHRRNLQSYLVAFGRFEGIALRKKWFLLRACVTVTSMTTKSYH